MDKKEQIRKMLFDLLKLEDWGDKETKTADIIFMIGNEWLSNGEIDEFVNSIMEVCDE